MLCAHAAGSRGAAAAHRDLDGVAGGMERGHSGEKANPLAYLSRPSEAGVRKDHQELLASPPTGNVPSPQFMLDSLHELAKDEVADGVAKCVVDVFEVVDVQQEQPQLAVVSPCGGDVRSKLLVQMAAIEDSSEEVCAAHSK